MRLLDPAAARSRSWSVELHTQCSIPRLVCAQCTYRIDPPRGTPVRSIALAHLARHARADTLPLYLRTCQCHENGCRWHSRHRGCAGSVVLVLARSNNGRTWRLADTCAACARATALAAVVPDAVHVSTLMHHGDAASESPPSPTERHPSEQVGVLLDYLSVALPPNTGAPAQLLALQCALRADSRGEANMSAGLLRGMFMHRDPSPWQDLEQGHWLHRLEHSIHRPVRAQLLDPVALTSSRPRSTRIRAADWALRTAFTSRLKSVSPEVRLNALILAVGETRSSVR